MQCKFGLDVAPTVNTPREIEQTNERSRDRETESLKSAECGLLYRRLSRLPLLLTLRLSHRECFFPPYLRFCTTNKDIRIQRGLLLLVGISVDDTEKEVETMAAKVLKMRMFEDEAGRSLWKSNVRQTGGQILSGMS